MVSGRKYQFQPAWSSVYYNLCDAAWLVLFGGNLPIYMYAYLELYIFIVPIMN